jgi:hypothetical protein
MTKVLLLIHAMLGDLGGVSFVWVLVEIINKKNSMGLKRARAVSMIGFVFLVLAWISGGYYYLTYYGSKVKPVIKASELKWAHGIVMEVKEHIFLLIPLLALLVVIILKSITKWEDLDKKSTFLLGTVTTFIFLLSILMAGMGAMIAISARSAVGGGL